MKIVSYLLWILVILIGVSFAGLNAQYVHFNYYFGNVELPLSLLLALGFAIGGFLGVFVSLSLIIRYKSESYHLKRQVKQQHPEKQKTLSD